MEVGGEGWYGSKVEGELWVTEAYVSMPFAPDGRRITGPSVTIVTGGQHSEAGNS